MVRVLHVIGSLDPLHGGPSFALVRILRMLAGSEVECSLAIGAMGGNEQEIIGQCSPYVRDMALFKANFKPRLGFSFAYARQCARMLAAADVVHIHGVWNWTSFWALSRAHALGLPTIIRPAGSLDPFDLQKHSGAKRLIGRAFHRRYLTSPRVMHCTSAREAEQIETFGGNALKTVLPLPVEPDNRSPVIGRVEARAKLGVPQDAEVVLFMSRIDYKKGLELLVPALENVRRTRPRLFFVIAGSGDREMEEKLNGLLAAAEIRNRTLRLGFVDGAVKAQALAAADIFVLPSMNENFGISVVEAMMAGVPVVISDQVYIADELRGARSVQICARNVPDLANAIARQLQAAGSDATLSAAARDEADRLYAPTVLRRRYVELYRQVAGNSLTKAGSSC